MKKYYFTQLFILFIFVSTVAFSASPTVTVIAPAGPTNSSSLIFTVNFSESVTGFDNNATTDLLINQTTGGALSAVVGGSGANYTVTITGMTGTGSVSLTIRAGAAQNVGVENNVVSNLASVDYDDIAPTVTINQSGSQVDPSNSTSVLFTAVFSEPVLGFTNSDITLGGTAGATTAVVSTSDNITWTVTVTGMTSDGTVTASIPASAASDPAGNSTAASTSTDNSVTVDITRPTVTVNQAGSQPDPTAGNSIAFTAIFSEAVTGFINSDVSISGTAGATASNVNSGDGGITWTITVTGVTSDGTVIVSIPANAAQDAVGNNNFASSSTDNTVTRDTAPPTITSLNPADNASGVGISSTFVITFSKNVKISTTGGVTGSQDLIEFYNGGSAQYSISRANVGGTIVISGNTATLTLPSSLDLATAYNIRIGSKVFSDLIDNDFAGISSSTTWNFTTTTGAVINNLSSSKCAGPFTPLSNIIITEDADENIQGFDNGSRTLTLGLSGPGFVFDPTSIPAINFTAGRDIQSISGIALNFTSLSFTVNFVNVSNDQQTRDDLDAITISGLKITYDGTSATPVYLVKTGGTINIQGVVNNVTQFATLNSGTTSVTPTLSTTDLTYCLNENIAATTILANAVGGATYRWYSDAGLTTLLTTGNPVNVTTGLGISSASAQDYTRYLTLTEAGKCESNALSIVIKVAPLPGANAGADQTVANGNTEVCSDQQISLGGSPTLTTLPIAGAYTYAWSSIPAITISNVSNPTVAINNTTGINTAYVFNLTITDPNGCIGFDSKNVDVRTAIVPQLTQPNSTVFSTNTAPQLLDANPTGGVFSGIGVTQTGPTTYRFSAASAYNNTLPLPQNFPIKYTVTSGGCTVTDFPIATMTLSNQLFTEIVAQYCSSERPNAGSVASIPPSQFQLKANVNSLVTLNNSVNNWNNSTRFFYAPNIGAAWRGDWLAFGTYNVNDYVRYNNEIYRAVNAIPFSLANPASSGDWVLTNLLKVDFNGTVRNFYEGFYGPNTNGKTVVKKSSTYTVSTETFNYYEMLTNINYTQCASCDYMYPAFYMEFITATDIRIMMQWNPSNYYYPNDVVYFGGVFYKQILTYAIYPYWTIGTQPNVNPAVWQAIGSTFDTGYEFSEGGASGVFATGQFVTINKNPTVQFAGLTSGLVNATEFCASNASYVLTGVVSGIAGDISGAGNFDMSYDGSTFTPKPGLNNAAPAPGNATFNPLTAYNSHTSLGTVRPFYIRYLYDPGTKGSTDQACIGSTVQTINVNLPPSVAFSTAPPDGTLFCPSAPAVDLSMSGTSTSAFTIALTGPGVSDQGSGNGKFDPATAIATLQTINNITYDYSNRPINYNYINAQITDANGCVGEISKPLTVNPIPPATVALFNPNVCYTGLPFVIDGGQINGFYNVVYKDVTNTETFGSLVSPQPDLTFDPKVFFDNAVALGANPLATLSYDVIYTTFDPDDCQRSLAPITIKIAPQIPVTIAGLNDLEEFCSNIAPPREVVLSPEGGILTIERNGSPIATPPIVNGKFTFGNLPLAGGDYEFNYDVITGNGCSNPTNINVTVHPSPVASFLALPKCEGDLINFSADGTFNNNAVPTYTWNFEGQPVIGQNTQFKFSGTGTYSVNLLVTYPPAGSTNTVCSSQSTLDQFVGLIPRVDFNITDVCLGDATQFEYIDEVTTISQAQWDFGDASTLAFGSVTQPVPPSALTSGTFGNPIHSFANAGNYTVTLTGRTSANAGSCANSKTKVVSILQYLTAAPGNIYSMKALNGEAGFWVPEDKNGNSTWEFAAPTGSVISSPQTAWVTNASGTYNSNDESYVNSPCLNISGFSRPLISMQYWINTPVSDGAVLQYSVDGGQTWPTLGSLVNNFSSGQNWYNIVGISSGPGGQTNFGWSANNMTDWQVAKHSLNVVPGARQKVRLRLAFSSVNSLNAPTFEGFAFNDVKIEDRNRTILAENFTNLNVSNVNFNNSQFRNFQSGLTETDIVKIQYHTMFPSEDAIAKQNVSDPNARAAFYGITQLPKAYIDGFSNGDFTGPWSDQYFNLRTLNTAKVELSGAVTVNTENTINGSVTVIANELLPANKYNVMVAVIERNVNSEDYVLRKMLPGSSGTSLPALVQNGAFNLTFNWVPDSRMVSNGTNLKVVAFVQELQNRKDIIQAHLMDVPDLTTVTGIESLMSDQITVYPNPANESFVIELPSKTETRLSVNLIDPVGRPIQELYFEKGEQANTINTQELAGGIYVVQIGAGKSGAIRKKVMVVHKQ